MNVDWTILLTIFSLCFALLLVLKRRQTGVPIAGSVFVVPAVARGLGIELALGAIKRKARKVFLFYDSDAELAEIKSKIGDQIDEDQNMKLYLRKVNPFKLKDIVCAIEDIHTEHGWISVYVDFTLPSETDERLIDQVNLDDFSWTFRERVLTSIAVGKMILSYARLAASTSLVFMFPITTVAHSYGRAPDFVAETALKAWVEALDTECQGSRVSILSVSLPKFGETQKRELIRPKIPAFFRPPIVDPTIVAEKTLSKIESGDRNLAFTTKGNFLALLEKSLYPPGDSFTTLLESVFANFFRVVAIMVWSGWRVSFYNLPSFSVSTVDSLLLKREQTTE